MKKLILFIWNILVLFGRILSFLRNALFNAILVVVLFIVAMSFFATTTPETPPHSILKLTIAGDIVEERRSVPKMERLVTGLLDSESQPDHMLLQDILDIIATAAHDPAIDALLLDMQGIGRIGLNQMQVIGEELKRFRLNKKKIIAAQDYYTQKQYYLAAYADTIILNSMGGVEIHGFGSYPLYFKEALDNLEINYHVFRVGTYKAAVEPLIRNDMSDAARRQNLSWLQDIWGDYINDIGELRKFPSEKITAYINNIDQQLAKVDGDTAALALQSGLVDLVLTRGELRKHLRKQGESTTLSLVTTEQYMKKIKPSYSEAKPNQAKIGIIVAEGNIVGGKQPAGLIGSESLGERLRSAKENEEVKAVVLRINSGGGSAFAAEIIRQELLELKKTGKPVVVSMGSMAASGGYWIAADADQIWASPVTLTGSIGIFGAIPTFENSLARLGIHSDGIGTTPLSSGFNLARPLQPAVEAAIQLTVENGYQRFLEIVTTGRGIPREQMADIAEGRVFSGHTAQQLGLVDNLGSLRDAIDATAELAGLTDYAPVYIEGQKTLRDELLTSLRATAACLLPDIMANPFPELTTIRDQISALMPMGDPQGIYAQALLHPPQ